MRWVTLLVLLVQDADPIAGWIEQLGDDSPQKREQAQSALIEAGNKAEAQLKAALDRKDSEIRTRARYILDHLAPDLEAVKEFESRDRLCFDPGSHRFAYYAIDGSLRLWTLEEGKEQKIPGEKQSFGVPPAFSPDGKVLAAELKPGEISFLEAGSWKETCTVAFPEDKVQSARRWLGEDIRPLSSALTGTGTLVTTCSQGTTFCSTDGKSEYERNRMLLVTPDGASFVGIARRQLIAGDALAFQRRNWGEQAEYGIHAIVASGDWKALFTLNPSDTLQVFNRDGLTLTATHSIPGPRVLSLAANRSGSWLVLGRDGGKIELWETASMKKETFSIEAGGNPIHVAWSRNGHWIAALIDGENPKIKLFRPNIRYR